MLVILILTDYKKRSIHKATMSISTYAINTANINWLES